VPRLVITADTGFLLICLVCEPLGLYHTMSRAYAFRSICDGAIDRLASLQTWWLGRPIAHR
jgi:hypothetical protein